LAGSFEAEAWMKAKSLAWCHGHAFRSATRATEPHSSSTSRNSLPKTAGSCRRCLNLPAAPEAKEDIQPRAQLIIHDHGVMDCIDPSLLFSLNRTGKINVSEVRGKGSTAS